MTGKSNHQNDSSAKTVCDSVVMQWQVYAFFFFNSSNHDKSKDGCSICKAPQVLSAVHYA